ncbi:hypothetical protein M5K25_008718 [Dendrobium thyrsiflorum]|uniref:Uncharacterized protein n=1 Tax=Dendrobium thyrsiflorum TaxID=117978 RepID=A0ABD0VG95_DENTH
MEEELHPSKRLSSLLLAEQTMQRFLAVRAAFSTPASRRSANYQPSLWDDCYIQSLPDRSLLPCNHTMEEELRPSKRLSSLLLAEQTMQRFLADGAAFSTPASRRSANYQPRIWDDCYIQSLLDGSLGATQVDLWEKLKEKVRNLIDYDKKNGIVELLEIVDALCQLGISYHFESEIKNVLSFLASSLGSLRNIIKNNLHGSALLFRLLREYNIKVAPRWFIDAYEKQENMNPYLLDFAKLDFNIVQTIYKKEFKEMSRKEITKLGCLLTTIDDIYDVYGSLEELVFFTKAVDEWKIPEIQPLPTCMKTALRELFNTVNDIACVFSTEKGVDILPYLKRVWGDQCKSYLVEAIWYHTGYIPTISEYMENAWITIGAPLFLTTAYCLSEELSIEALNSLESYFDVTLYSGMFFMKINE